MVVLKVRTGGSKSRAVCTDSSVFTYGTQTLGTAVKQSIPEASWDSVKIDDKRYTVTVFGYCPDLSSVVQVDFDVNYSGDYVYAKTKNVWMDGDCYDDIFSIALVMQGIY